MVAPPGHWLLGHVSALRQRPLELLDQCPPGVVPLRLGRTIWLIVEPDDVQHVLERSESIYTKGRAFQFGKKLYGNSLLVSEGPDHRQQAKDLGRLFFRHAASSFLAPAAEITDAWLNQWRTGDRLDLWDSVIDLTLAISSRAIFGSDYLPTWISGREDRKTDGILNAYNQAMAHVARQNFSILPLPDWLPTPNNRRYQAAIKILDRAFLASMERRKLGLTSGGFIDQLLTAHRDNPKSMPLSQVRDQALVLTLGGFESTATALCWTILLLAVHSEVRKRVQADVLSCTCELARPAHLAEFQYLPQVLSESLRLYPPPWLIPRTAALADTLPSGHQIPAGTSLFLSPWRTQRDGRFFDDPLRFDPDRFSPLNARDHFPGSYFPFGMGPRHCLGESIARQQMAVIIATIFRRAIVRPVSGVLPQPKPLLTLRPELPIPVQIEFQDRS